MSNILKKVCSAQKQYCAEHADSMENPLAELSQCILDSSNGSIINVN